MITPTGMRNRKSRTSGISSSFATWSEHDFRFSFGEDEAKAHHSQEPSQASQGDQHRSHSRRSSDR